MPSSKLNPERSQKVCRNEVCEFLDKLEQQLELQNGKSLQDKQLKFLDIAIFPLIRQFAMVGINWFRSTAYHFLNNRFSNLYESNLFKSSMVKYEQ